jgi:hypothetical protein
VGLLVAALAPSAWPGAKSDEAAVRYLDAVTRTLTRAVDPASGPPGAARFVEVEVVEVFNPTLAGLSFEVFFDAADMPRVRLGTFSLFPADNPGTFIVATQGKVDRPGMLVLVMVTTAPVSAGVVLKVGIARIELASGLDRH